MVYTPEELLEELQRFLERRVRSGDRRITKIELQGDNFVFTYNHEGVTREVPITMNDAQAILSGFKGVQLPT